MGRNRATSWLVALFIVALGGMGLARDLHAASHVPVSSFTLGHSDATPPGSTPLHRPDSSREGHDCPTCDLLVVLAHGWVVSEAPAVVERAALILALDALTPTDPVVIGAPRDNRTRAPPAAHRPIA